MLLGVSSTPQCSSSLATSTSVVDDYGPKPIANNSCHSFVADAPEASSRPLIPFPLFLGDVAIRHNHEWDDRWQRSCQGGCRGSQNAPPQPGLNCEAEIDLQKSSSAVNTSIPSSALATPLAINKEIESCACWQGLRSPPPGSSTPASAHSCMGSRKGSHK